MAPTDDEKLWAAIAHASGCFVWLLGPLIVFVLKKEQSPFVAYHAVQAGVFHLLTWVAFTVFTLVTCGFGAMVFPIFWLPAFWLAWKVWQGSPGGYPGIAGIGRTDALSG